jgi:NADH-quinone oxidoreductase subunit F
VVNNVETLAYVPTVVGRGSDWFAKLGSGGQGGMKIYTVSGSVKRPGAWELPLGTTIRELIEEHAGGMRDGMGVRAVLPGGGSTRFVLEKDLDTPMDDASLGKVGSRLGTGTIIVLDDHTCPAGMLSNLEHFYAQESCGWCTPCWQGLQWVDQILETIESGQGTDEDLALLDHHVRHIKPERTFCDFAPGAMEPLESGLEFFRADFEEHIQAGRCPWEPPAARWGATRGGAGRRR